MIPKYQNKRPDTIVSVKFGKLPVKIGLSGQYMVHHPDVGGQKWNIQVMVVPVIPKLIKGNLFGE